ncbi:hypothetical protein INR49_006312 [Caranx melampygus]|nr:hypothetical protein INR49_006312 [Caranx melampygus]
MPRVGTEEELRTLTECQYRHPAETLADLRRVRSLFSDLRLYVDFYCFPNKEKKKLVYLAGTVPVHYEGTEYNIPVCIWLHETHPVSRPRCYVCPSTSMVINPYCPCVDASGNISLDGLRNWTHGMSNLSLLMSEMRRAFQVNTPLYARCPAQTPPPVGVQASQVVIGGGSESLHHPRPSSSSSSSITTFTSDLPGQKEELLGIDFSAPSPSSSSSHNNPFLSSSFPGLAEPLSRSMGTLRLDEETSRDLRHDSPSWIVRSETVQDRCRTGPGPALGPREDLDPRSLWSETDLMKMVSRLSPDQAAIFLSLMRMEGRSFSPSDVMEAIITMTHCSCFLCQTCFKTFFSAAIKERSVDQLVCPQCGRPEVRGQGGMEESMDYFNLLDTQVQHRPGLQVSVPMPAGSHSTHKRVHVGPAQCPNCQLLFSLSKGGCLHFTCSQCQHQFCGGCSQTFTLGSACGLSADCGTKGLHAHHPRDCLYHLRDWSVTRLHLLLQYYRVSPWLEPANGSSPDTSVTGVCLVLELKDDGSRREEPCGRPTLPENRGYCQLHYKERLVELINRCRADPAVLFNPAEMIAELKRWHVAVPTRKPDESEPLYAHRLRLVSHHYYCFICESPHISLRSLEFQSKRHDQQFVCLMLFKG